MRKGIGFAVVLALAIVLSSGITEYMVKKDCVSASARWLQFWPAACTGGFAVYIESVGQITCEADCKVWTEYGDTCHSNPSERQVVRAIR